MSVGSTATGSAEPSTAPERGTLVLTALILVAAVANLNLAVANVALPSIGAGYAFCLMGFVTMLVLWKEGIANWEVGLAYAFVGAGVGFAGTPASHSLTGSVPVHKAGMASGTADLQRDLGGAIMQSILGALLAAGYAAAMTAQIAAAPQSINDSVQSQLTKSFSSAEALGAQYPQYAAQITAAAKSSFLQGDDWAYVAGIVAILLGAVLVFFMFPKNDDEKRLLAEYHEIDTAR